MVEVDSVGVKQSFFSVSGVSPELKRAFVIKCFDAGLSQSDVVRRLVQGWVEGNVVLDVGGKSV